MVGKRRNAGATRASDCTYKSEHIFRTTPVNQDILNIPPLPTYAAIYPKGAIKPMDVTMNHNTMAFYLDNGCTITPLIPAQEAANAITAARAMFTIHKMCFQRGFGATKGDKVMFDNGMFPLTSNEEASLSELGITIGGAFEVAHVVAGTIPSSKELSLVGIPGITFPATKFLILPK